MYGVDELGRHVVNVHGVGGNPDIPVYSRYEDYNENEPNGSSTGPGGPTVGRGRVIYISNCNVQLQG